MTISEEKALLRTAQRRLGRTLSPQERLSLGQAVTRQLTALPDYQAAHTVLAFYGTGHELDTRPLLEQILSDGKTLCLPLCLPQGQMEACRVTDLARLIPGPFGIPTPPDDAPRLSPEALDFIAVPCVCCTRSGWRLGQGGGYYDRFLPRCSAIAAVICPELLLVDAVPRERHDCRLPLVVSEERIYQLSEASTVP